jgi:hypothetical protein
MARGSKYSDEFVAQVLAQCDLSTNVSEVLKQHRISSSTHFDWMNRSERDERLGKLRMSKRKELEKEWKRFAISSLRKAFQRSNVLLDACNKPEHLEYINQHIKTVGELAVNIEVLNDLGQTETQITQDHSSSQSGARGEVNASGTAVN